MTPRSGTFTVVALSAICGADQSERKLAERALRPNNHSTRLIANQPRPSRLRQEGWCWRRV